jgi:hypothetical protein
VATMAAGGGLENERERERGNEPRGMAAGP